jgi:hypothetical protein
VIPIVDEPEASKLRGEAENHGIRYKKSTAVNEALPAKMQNTKNSLSNNDLCQKNHVSCRRYPFLP